MIEAIIFIRPFIIQLDNTIDMLIDGDSRFECDNFLIPLFNNVRFLFLLWELQYT